MHSFVLFSLCARRVDSFSRALVTPGAKYSLTTAVTVNFAAPNACINLEHVRSASISASWHSSGNLYQMQRYVIESGARFPTAVGS